jgi:hypothetical protein
MYVNPEVLSNVVESALAAFRGDGRWERAINRGAHLIEEDRCLPAADGSLTIFSDSGREYHTTETDCRTTDGPCKAHSLGHPCKHRAAFHLMVMLEDVDSGEATSH